MASIKLAGLISLIMAASSGSTFAQQGTDAQREACTPDAFRLCTSAMPDSGRVESCLRAAGPRLSAGCYAVFYPPQSAAETGPDRGRRQREVQRQQDRRGYDQGGDQPRDVRRDDGFGGFERRDFQSRPQPQYEDD